jgi:RNA polymerase sigma-70 factor (ECF subfamily)
VAGPSVSAIVSSSGNSRTSGYTALSFVEIPTEPFSGQLRNEEESVHDLPAQSGRNQPTQGGGSAWQASSVESSGPTDEALLEQFCESGDEASFEALLHRYERELFNYLRRYLGQAEMAEDVFQATFLQIYLKKEQFEQGRRFRPWLYTIATNQAIDAQRRNKRHRMVSLDNRRGDDDVAALVEVLAGNDPTAAQRFEQEEAKAWVRSAVDDLPDQLRATLLLVYHQGLKYREAADALGIPVGTVKSRLHSALIKLNESWTTQCGT